MKKLLFIAVVFMSTTSLAKSNHHYNNGFHFDFTHDHSCGHKILRKNKSLYGKLLNADGKANNSTKVQFLVEFRGPGERHCLWFQTTEERNLASSRGYFSIRLKDDDMKKNHGKCRDEDKYDDKHGDKHGDKHDGKHADKDKDDDDDKNDDDNDHRRIELSYNDGSFSGWRPVPDEMWHFGRIAPVAWQAVFLDGHSPENFMRVQDSGATPEAIPAFTKAEHSELLSLINGTSSSFKKESPLPKITVNDLPAEVVLTNDSRLSDARAPKGNAGGDLSGTYPNPTVKGLQGRSVSSAQPAIDSFFKFNGNQWESSFLNINDVKSVTGSSIFANANCAVNQTLVWISVSGEFACQNIQNLDASAIATGTISDDRLPAGLLRTDALGNLELIGNLTANDIVAKNIKAENVESSGEVRAGNSQSDCSATNEGAMRYNSISKSMEFCNSENWIAIGADSSSQAVANFGISASADGGSLVIQLTDKKGSAPSKASAVSLQFRNPVSEVGRSNEVTVASSVQISVPAGANLGHVANMDQYVWVYLLNNGGTVDMCVSGVNVFFDTSLNNSIALSASSNDGRHLYCNQAHEGKPTRLIGRIRINASHEAGWDGAPLEVALLPKPIPTVTDWTPGVINMKGTVKDPVLPTLAVNKAFYRRNGSNMEILYQVVSTGAGTTNVGSGVYIWNLPYGQVDTNVLTPSVNNGTAIVGYGKIGDNATTADWPVLLGVYNSTHLVMYSSAAQSGKIMDWNDGIMSKYFKASFSATVPIKGWSTYGP